MMIINLPERFYCADVDYTLAVVGTPGRGLIAYTLEGTPKELKRNENLFDLQGQKECTDRIHAGQHWPHRHPVWQPCQSEGQFHIEMPSSHVQRAAGYQDICAVNDILFHGVLATVVSGGMFSFWDKDARTKFTMDQPIAKCGIRRAVGYDWFKGHEYFNPFKKSAIFLRPYYEELKPRST